MANALRKLRREVARASGTKVKRRTVEMVNGAELPAWKAQGSTPPDHKKGPARSPTQREQWAMRRAAAALAAEEAAEKSKAEAA